jgi:hypothetical protein
VRQILSAATQIIEEQIEESIETEIEQRPIVDEINLDKLTDEATELIRQGEPKKALALLKPHLKTIGAQHAGAWRIRWRSHGTYGTGHTCNSST